MTTTEPIDGGITAPAGFRASGVHAGIKAKALDMALIAAERPVPAAGLFTTNLAAAAPVLVCREHLDASTGRAAAVIVNSGCANACTGDAGLAAAREMAAETAALLGCAPEEVLVASTGVIGVALDMGKVRSGIAAAHRALGRHGRDAALAIMTTDPFPKEAAVQVTLASGTFRVGGIAKGSGMIEPHLATMLAFVTTDADVATPLLQRALAEAVDDTFNAITVDGECSTNDAVIALASGASGIAIGDRDLPLLSDALRAVCRELAIGIVRGGEGATKLVEIRVTGGATAEQARTAARAIANSLLVKTAIHGGDPNWGRLVAVAGRAGVDFRLAAATVAVGDVVLFAGGRPFDERAPDAAVHLQGTSIAIDVDLGTGGPGEGVIWTCDLSAEYVRINAEYRT